MLESTSTTRFVGLYTVFICINIFQEINGKSIHTEQAVRSIGMDRGMRGRGGGRRGSSRGGYLDRPRHMSGSRRSPPPRRGGFSMRGGRGGPPRYLPALKINSLFNYSGSEM